MQSIKKLLRKDDFDELVKKVNTIDISGLLKKINYGNNVTEIESKIPSIIGLATTTAL